MCSLVIPGCTIDSKPKCFPCSAKVFFKLVAPGLRAAFVLDAREGEQQRAISLVVRIAAFQAVDPGSNPGWRITFYSTAPIPFVDNCGLLIPLKLAGSQFLSHDV